MENTVDFFTDLGIPFPEANAAFVARLEYYGGMLLLLGLLDPCDCPSPLVHHDRGPAHRASGRPASERSRRTGEIGLSDLPPFVLGVLLSWLVVKGPGALSLDRLITAAAEKKKTPEPPA